MWKAILQIVKATFPVIAGLSALISSAYSQQNIIADKDNTRPEFNNGQSVQAKITSFTAIKASGYNDIQWSALMEEDTRRFIVEYSTDGITYQSAGETAVADGNYELKHQTFETRPLLYRLRAEKADGKFYTSPNILLNGVELPPVKVYPTSVTGSTVNVQSEFAAQRMTLTSFDGLQVLEKNLGGVNGYMKLTLPTLNEGMYIMTFYGDGWKSSTKIVIDK